MEMATKDCSKQDRDQLGKWAEKWQIEFNSDTCEALLFGKSNQARSFAVNDRALGVL